MFKAQTVNSKNSKSNNISPFQKRNDVNAFIQPKLNIGKPGDQFETEADRTADAIVSMNNDQTTGFFSPAPLIQKLPGDFQKQTEVEEEEVQAKPEEEEKEEVQAKVEEEEEVQAKTEEEEEVQAKVEEVEVQTKAEDGTEIQKAVVEPVIQQKPEISTITPIVQSKIEEEIQEKEEEEEEPVQAKLLVQKSEEPDTDVEEEPLPVQAKLEGGKVGNTTIESQLNSSKGGGSPLNENVQTQMESGFGTDFSNVRVHTDSNSVQMNKNLGAQAFTHGSDIYFNEGKYQPESNQGKHLLAHELTHTVQQGKSPTYSNTLSTATPNAQLIQKIDEPESPISVEEVTQQHPSPKGTIEKTGSAVTVFLNQLRYKSNAPSSVLSGLSLPYQLPGPGSRSESPTRQARIWSGAVSSDTETSLENLLAQIETDRPMSEKKATSNLYKLTLKRGSGQAALAGYFTQLKNAAIIPPWNRRGQTISFQVEHVLDYQIAGSSADNIENLILLEASTNNFLGDVMRNYIRGHINDLLEHYNRYVAADELVNSADAARENYTIKANSFAGVVHEFIADRAFFRQDYTPGLPFNPLSPSLVELESLTIPPGHFILKTSRSSTGLLLPYSAQNLDVGSLRLTLQGNEQDGLSSITAMPILNGNHVDEEITPDTYSLTRVVGTHTYTAETAFGRRQLMRGLRLRYLSLMEFSELQLDDGLNIRAEGRINAPSPAFLNNTPIEISIVGKTLSIQKTFSANDLASVGPFSIDYAALTLGLNTQDGLTAAGSVGFSISGVGSGLVNASASQGNFMLSGNFGFESEKIDGNLEMNYSSASDHGEPGGEAQSAWGIEGSLTLRDIRGIKSATITVGYENQTITGSATSIELDVPGITVNSISLSYGVDSQNFEFTISAGTSRIPGIQSADVTATLSSGGGGEEGGGSGDLALNISGSATFRSIPGLQNPTLTISYDSSSGVIDISASLEFERGKVSGSVTVGVTNRQVSDGIASGEAGEDMHIYGDGQLSIAITDEFTPQLGARLTPEGDILINGWVNVDLQLGEGYNRERTLFGIDITPIPIFTIGIAQVLLTAGGSLGVYANINPIAINGRIGFEDFNPAVPDSFEAVMEATARASAEAGLKFDAYLGIMASAAIVYAEGRLVVQTRIGAQAGAEITGRVTWSAARGFEISNANASLDLALTANASLVLHVGAGIYLYVSRIEVWSEDFPIASTDFPPLAQMQASLPISFENGALRQISADDITITNNPLDNPEATGRFLQGTVTDVGQEPEEAGLSEFQSQILAEIRQYPSIGPVNPDYYVLYGKQFLVDELKINYPDEDWSWLDQELADMEYAEFIDFRAYILGQPCSSSRQQEMQMFGINHPSIGPINMGILESELQEQEDECLIGADVPTDTS